MDAQEFSAIRKMLGKTQKQLAQLLGTSLKAIHSYEQGWRNIPVHVERQLLFLVSRKHGQGKGLAPCWQIKACLPENKEQCPAWEFHAGDLCWFINGTICEGVVHTNWKEKISLCRKCVVFMTHIGSEYR